MNSKHSSNIMVDTLVHALLHLLVCNAMHCVHVHVQYIANTVQLGCIRS